MLKSRISSRASFASSSEVKPADTRRRSTCSTSIVSNCGATICHSTRSSSSRAHCASGSPRSSSTAAEVSRTITWCLVQLGWTPRQSHRYKNAIDAPLASRSVRVGSVPPPINEARSEPVQRASGLHEPRESSTRDADLLEHCALESWSCSNDAHITITWASCRGAKLFIADTPCESATAKFISLTRSIDMPHRGHGTPQLSYSFKWWAMQLTNSPFEKWSSTFLKAQLQKPGSAACLCNFLKGNFSLLLSSCAGDFRSWSEVTFELADTLQEALRIARTT